MKVAAFLFFLGVLTASTSVASELNEMLDEAKKVQLEYEKEAAAAPLDSPTSKRLRHEFQNANKQLIDYAKAKGDSELKTIVLRICFYEKMLMELTDVEYSSDEAEIRSARTTMNEYALKLKRVAEMEKQPKTE